MDQEEQDDLEEQAYWEEAYRYQMQVQEAEDEHMWSDYWADQNVWTDIYYQPTPQHIDDEMPF